MRASFLACSNGLATAAPAADALGDRDRIEIGAGRWPQHAEQMKNAKPRATAK